MLYSFHFHFSQYLHHSFIDPSNLLTLGTLILIPMLFGYTAYISREQFKYSSFLGFISLMFVPLGPIMAAVAVTVSVGNLLVSFFAGGTNFKDYYGSTMLPLLFTGLILGGAVYGLATYQPSFGDDLRKYRRHCRRPVLNNT